MMALPAGCCSEISHQSQEPDSVGLWSRRHCCHRRNPVDSSRSKEPGGESQRSFAELPCRCHHPGFNCQPGLIYPHYVPRVESRSSVSEHSLLEIVLWPDLGTGSMTDVPT